MKKKVFLILLIIIIGVLSVLGYARFIEPNLLTVKTITIETELDVGSRTLVFFTDTHFGKYYDVGHVEKIVEKINEINPEFVVFGGDLLDNYARDRDSLDLEYLKKELKKINHGIKKCAVWGNHDYGGGAADVYKDIMRSCGFQLLDNLGFTIFDDHSISVFGYDDYLMGEGMKEPSLYKAKGKGTVFNVIIAHEPIVSQLLEIEEENLLLCGHTHGGQVTIPFLTSRLLPEGSGKFVKGLYSEKEIGTDTSLQMYVSSGIGMTKYPFRFLNVPEIVEIKIQGPE